MWVRQVAWLNTAPQPKETRKNEAEPKTRMERMEAAGEQIALPPNSARYLTNWLFEIGPSAASGLGEARIGHRELVAWQEIMGIELMPWEAKLLLRLSGEYIDERTKARKPERVAPFAWSRTEIENRRDIVAKKVDAMFRGLKGKA